MGFNISPHAASILRKLTRRRSFPLVVRRCGATFILDPRNWLDCEIAMWRPFEVEQIDHARTVIQKENLNTFVDVGANFGLYTVLLGAIATITDVMSFEPVRRNYAQLLANVFANRLEMKVETYRLALGDRTAESIIRVDPRATAISRFIPSLEGRNPSDFTHEERVSVSPLDQVLTLEGSRIFVKIDVEGHAAPVVRGMRSLLARNEVVLQIELFDEERREIIELLHALDYSPMEAFGRDQYFRRT